MRTTAIRASAAAWVALLALAVTAASAAADPEDGLWYITDTGIAEAQQSVTGEGVTIAIADSPINPNAPALQGADIRYSGVTSCPDGTPLPATSTGQDADHATTLASLIVGNGEPVNGYPGIQGVAPDATVISINDGRGHCGLSRDHLQAYVQDAIAQGADMLIFASNLLLTNEDAEPLAEAMAQGLIVLAALPNHSSDEFTPAPVDGGYMYDISMINGLVAVETAGPGGVRDDPVPDWVDIVAPGDKLLDYDSLTDPPFQVPAPLGGGTSTATPIAAGVLALTMQAYPDATPNQILQSLARNTGRDGVGNPDLNHTPLEGYGFINVTNMIANDATQYPDENPFISTDPDAYPPAGALTGTDDQTTGTEQTGTEQTGIETPNTGAAGDTGDDRGYVVPIAIGLIAAVIIGATLLIIALTRRNRTTTPPPTWPPAPHDPTRHPPGT